MKSKILAICGSTKQQSTNLSIIHAIAGMAVERADVQIYDTISDLAIFNPDLDTDTPPASVAHLRKLLADSDAVVICTPEYVFSIPGVLKNALEWTVSSSSFSGKPVAIIVASSLGEKTFESLQLVMKTIEAKFDSGTTLLIQGAKSRWQEADLQEALRSVADTLLAMI